MQMEATLDTGAVYLEAREPIAPDDTVETLEPRLSALGGPLLVETLDRLEANTIMATPQSADGMTYAYPVTRETGFLNPMGESAAQMERKVRALSPRPGTWLVIAGKPVKVLSVEVQASLAESIPGTITALPKNGIVIATPDASLLITRLQPENKSAMTAADFARGSRLSIGDSVIIPT